MKHTKTHKNIEKHGRHIEHIGKPWKTIENIEKH